MVNELKVEKTKAGWIVRIGRKKYRIVLPRGERISERELIKFLIKRFHRKRKTKSARGDTHSKKNQAYDTEAASSGVGWQKFDLYNKLEEKLKEKPLVHALAIQAPQQSHAIQAPQQSHALPAPNHNNLDPRDFEEMDFGVEKLPVHKRLKKGIEEAKTDMKDINKALFESQQKEYKQAVDAAIRENGALEFKSLVQFAKSQGKQIPKGVGWKKLREIPGVVEEEERIKQEIAYEVMQERRFDKLREMDAKNQEGKEQKGNGPTARPSLVAPRSLRYSGLPNVVMAESEPRNGAERSGMTLREKAKTAQGGSEATDRSKDGLSTSDIEKIMGKYEDFLGALPRDGLKDSKVMQQIENRDRIAVIINTDKSTGPGKHWTALYIDNRPGGSKSVDYYNSFGEPCPSDLLKDIKTIVDKMKPSTYLKFKESAVAVQSSNSSNCGQFCCRFLIDRFRGKSFADASGYTEVLKGNIRKNEKEINKEFKYL